MAQLETVSVLEPPNLNDLEGTHFTLFHISDKSLLIAHIGLACILGVFAGGLYFKVDITISGFQNRVGSLFFLGVLLAFMSLR